MIVRQNRRAEIVAEINERRREAAMRVQAQYDAELEARIAELNEVELDDE